MTTRPERSARDRRRDFWQLDVPLVLVLTLCVTLTIVEAFRATDGIWRAWVYLVEWPIIGLGAVWIWRHYRFEDQRAAKAAAAAAAEGSAETASPAGDAAPERPKRRPFGAGLLEHYQERAEAITREYDEQQAADQGLDAWHAYQSELQRTQPPVGPAR